MRSVDFTCLLQYCINLNNSSITPILLTYVENLVSLLFFPHSQDIRQPCQLQSALTYLVLSRTRENCKNPTIVTSIVKRIRVCCDFSLDNAKEWIAEQPSELNTIMDRLFLHSELRQNMWKAVVDTLGTVLPNVAANSVAFDRVFHLVRKCCDRNRVDFWKNGGAGATDDMLRIRFVFL